MLLFQQGGDKQLGGEAGTQDEAEGLEVPSKWEGTRLLNTSSH